MGTPDEEQDQYVKDPRKSCRFGLSCYQKNPLHHQKYKHPPKKRPVKQDSKEAPAKKRKTSIDSEGTSNSVKVSNDISDSDESVPSEIVNDEAPDLACETEQKNLSKSSNQPLAPLLSPTGLSELPSGEFQKKSFIHQKFLVRMPEDFYSFWEFSKTLNSANPSNAFSSVGLTLVGPYDVLADKFTNVGEKPSEEYLIHWRYYHDPPEFQTLIKGSDVTGYHIGYFRDSPSDLPVFVASNHAKKNGEISCMGENIFAAVSQYLEEAKKSCDPFKKMNITKLQTAVKTEAEKLHFSLSQETDGIAERNKKIVVRSFNKAGLVVPYDRKTQLGYRHLCISNKELTKLLDRMVTAESLPTNHKDKVMSEFQQLITATDIAIDECDFGTGIELGWNILAHGIGTVNNTIGRFLRIAYSLIQREAFGKIAMAHMQNRKEGTDLSIL